ncbi:Fas-associated factor [Nesidiocoris tenuis]|uniref:Fas-associated factor n=1 Tax=Nesidiocoris tenuis TaxID=355587 RepID=A0ABN7AHK9_9HEMI|nr:Fas-associated factor [Nesidiocoris tenuis]
MSESMDSSDIDPRYGREEILADFQGCTGIEDVGESIEWLEAADWNLVAAVQNAVPQQLQALTEMFTRSGVFHSQNNRNGGVPISLSSDFPSGPSTSNQKTLKLKIHLESDLQKYPLTYELHENMTLQDLQTLIFSDSSIPPCSQHFTGWEIEPTSDNPPLSKLVKSSTVTLILREMDKSEGLSSLYHLKIKDKEHNTEYHLRLPGATLVRNVMKDAEILTGIKTSAQLWDGWPPGQTDESTLASLHLERPTHTLCVRISSLPQIPTVGPAEPSHTRNRVQSSSRTGQRSMYIDLTESDSSPEDFEDAPETFTDEMFAEDSVSRRTEPLIPDNVEDETAASVHFNDGFSRRYGPNMPNFFFGSLEEAMKEAFSRPARERRMLGIYLHHDRSVLSNVFCTELLGARSVLETFNNFFVLWGWDLTNEANRNMLLALVMSNLGVEAASTIRRMAVDTLPALMIFARTSYNSENLSTIFGNVGLTEFTGYLMHAVELYTSIQETEIREEDERVARDRIKTEQDQAFQQSLLADRAKEEAKRKQKEQETLEEQRKKENEEAEERRRQEEREVVLARLPSEPADGTPEVITLRFRNPTGIFVRKFLPSHTLQVLFDYLLTEGFPAKNYKIIRSWPRSDISTIPPETTLKDINIPPQETLTLEER